MKNLILSGAIILNISCSAFAAGTTSTPVNKYAGSWVTSTRYARGSIVTYDNRLFLALATSSGKIPVNQTAYWQLLGTIGNVILNGVGVPSDLIGNKNDYYIDNTNKVIYGPKTDFGWAVNTSLIGPTGPQGIQGLKGNTGDTGVQGLQGVMGPQGIPGLKGDTGIQGIQGIQGLKGDTGDSGPQGIQGAKGDKGDTGPASPYKPVALIDDNNNQLGNVFGAVEPSYTGLYPSYPAPTHSSINLDMPESYNYDYLVITSKDYIFKFTDDLMYVTQAVENFYETSDCSGLPTLFTRKQKGKIFQAVELVGNNKGTLIYNHPNIHYYIPFDAPAYNGSVYNKAYGYDGTSSCYELIKQNSFFRALPNEYSVTGFDDNYARPVRLSIKP